LVPSRGPVDEHSPPFAAQRVPPFARRTDSHPLLLFFLFNGEYGLSRRLCQRRSFLLPPRRTGALPRTPESMANCREQCFRQGEKPALSSFALEQRRFLAFFFSWRLRDPSRLNLASCPSRERGNSFPFFFFSCRQGRVTACTGRRRFLFIRKTTSSPFFFRETQDPLGRAFQRGVFLARMEGRASLRMNDARLTRILIIAPRARLPPSW